VPLISATAAEVRRLIAQARAWAESLGKPVALWLSDRRDAFVTGIAAEFPGVPHRYCDNHFLRDVAKPALEADSHAKVQMRKKVRGPRKIEQAVLKRQDAQASGRLVDGLSGATMTEAPKNSTASQADPAGTVVLDYRAAARGILNDDQGGPLHPPGLRMADALDEVRASIERNLDAKKGDSPSSNSAVWLAASTAAERKCATNRHRSAITSKTSRKSPRPSSRQGRLAPTDRRSSRR